MKSHSNYAHGLGLHQPSNSTKKHENSDYNIANFDARKLPCFRGMFLHPPQWKKRAYTWRLSLTWRASLAISFRWIIIYRVCCQNNKGSEHQSIIVSSASPLFVVIWVKVIIMAHALAAKWRYGVAGFPLVQCRKRAPSKPRMSAIRVSPFLCSCLCALTAPIEMRACQLLRPCPR